MNLEGYEKLNRGTKGPALTILFQLPFCVLSVFLFRYDLYERKDYILLTCLCLAIACVCMSISILLMTGLVVIGRLIVPTRKKASEDMDKFEAELFLWTVAHVIITHFTGLFVGYIIHKCWQFPYAVYVVFIVIWSIVIALFLLWLSGKNYKQLKKDIE